MKYEINTRFNVGDTIYHYYEAVHTETGLKPNVVKDTVKSIEVHFYECSVNIWYITEFYFTVNENEAFASETEAVQYFNKYDINRW